MSDEILHAVSGKVMTVTLNRPGRGNRVTNDMARELARVLRAAGDDVRAVLFRGAGDDFCLGRDAMGGEPRLEAYDLRELNEVVFDCYAAFRDSKAPVVGVVQGRALGFGCALAAVCDVTLATPESRFALPEMAHGIMPTMAMSSMAGRVSRKGALYLTYATEEIDAATALAHGLASRIVPAGELDAAVARLAGTMASASLPANRAVKEYARHAFAPDAAAAVDLARNLHATINSSSRVRK